MQTISQELSCQMASGGDQPVGGLGRNLEDETKGEARCFSHLPASVALTVGGPAGHSSILLLHTTALARQPSCGSGYLRRAPSLASVPLSLPFVCLGCGLASLSH